MSFGLISRDVCEYFDINEKVLYAEIDVKTVLDKYSIKPVQFKSISKFPEVTRDLSILIDDDLNFENILIDKTSADLLKGSEVDYVSELIGESFKISNPQTKSSCGCGVSFSL